MLNIDPLLFQPKVIRMSTTSSIGLPHGQHIIRTTEYSNSQFMTGTAAQLHNEANNNMMTTNTIDTAGEFASRGRDFGNTSGRRDLRNYNEMELSNDVHYEGDLAAQPEDWSSEMYWSGEGDVSDNSALDLIAHQNSASIMSFQSNLTNSTPNTSFHSQLSEQSESSKFEPICTYVSNPQDIFSRVQQGSEGILLIHKGDNKRYFTVKIEDEEIIHSMLSKVRSQNKVEASKVLLAMSNSVENCLAMRQYGCLPLLIQLLHSPDENSNTYHMVHAKRVNFEIRERASQVLHNIVFSQPDDKKGRREARVLRLLEQIRDYCDQLRNLDADIDDNRNSRCVDQHIGPTVATLMKLSFDEDHRHAMCQLGGLQAIAELLQIDHEVHGCTSDQYCIIIRRYSGMALTNLTFGDGANKALLCSMRPFMNALVAQLYSPSEDLRQVTASVLRNLSWRADPTSKRILRDTGAVTILVKAAMEAEKESTLKSILSALWNLSAHCSANKVDICLVDGSLAFLVSTLIYKSKSKTLAIVENGGGILRNVSSHIAIQNEYRAILRKHNCLQILLQHLKSPSLTVVSNACGTLWNLSARNAVDQRALWEMGAVGMLKKLINSKHKMISMGSSAALKNLLSAKPPGVALGLCVHNDGFQGSTDVPSLHIRKEKALSQEIDQNLAETYDNTDSPKTSPSHHASNEKGNRVRRHISPSARYYTTQKQKNDLLSLQNRGKTNDEKLTYVVEEKHNGAFQVIKNAKPPSSYLQGPNRLQMDEKNSSQGVDTSHVASRNGSDFGDPSKTKKNADVHIHTPKVATHPRSDSEPRHHSEIMPPQMGVRKDYKGSDRVTNVAQMSKTVSREQFQDTPARHSTESSGIPKPVHESRIPLPKSCTKLDAQRSQSASPVPQRRTLPPRQSAVQSSNCRNADVNLTHPKYAWTNNCYEKEDMEPEQPEKFSRHALKQEHTIPQPQPKPYKSVPPQVPSVDDFSFGNEDEIKVYNTENTPMNYSLNSSVADLEEAATAGRCSLNIKTCTNVKLMKNHALLANVSNNRAEDDYGKLFESRNGSKDYRNFEGGKTVDFSVQSDYEIDENMSILSRSSSAASVSSFDQQSFHDDESFASDLSQHTSGIVSPCEFSDSPGQTIPTSPLKSQNSNLSDGQQMKLPVLESESPDSLGQAHDSVDISCSKAELEKKMVASVESSEHTTHVEKRLPAEVYAPENILRGDSEIDILAAKLASDSYISPERHSDTVGHKKIIDGDKTKTLSEEQSVSEVTESADFVTCVSEFNSSSSVECETMEDISPMERIILEKCIRAGLPQKSADKNQGTNQKPPQLAQDNVEKRSKPCTSNTERGHSTLDTLDIKEGEYESHSENEEKGKEDERKAEKKRLFRIPESPVDKKTSDINNGEYSAEDDCAKPDEQPQMFSMKVVVDQKGNRRFEKHSDKSKSKKGGAEPVPCQLDFLMTNKNTPVCKPDTNSCTPQKLQSNVRDAERTDDTPVEETKCNLKHVNNEESGIEGRDLSPKLESRSEDVEGDISSQVCEQFEKATECSEKEIGGDSEESFLSSSMLCEAREIAEALLGARIGSTEDMTVSTLSCLSDIDNARPPSVLGEMGSLSMTNSLASEDSLKVAVSKECQKLLGKSYKQSASSKKSLLRELQIGRLNNEQGTNDNSKGSNDSPENSSLKSSSASDFLLGNVNPPSILDEMSLTASTGSFNDVEGGDSENALAPYPSKQDSMSERMNNAAAIAQLYAKELSNITGYCIKESPSNESLTRMKTQPEMQDIVEVTIADITEIGCDTIGSDTELDDDFPCDDEDLGSETLQAPGRHCLSRDDPGEGSVENLTLTLTDDVPKSPCADFGQNGYFMTAEELKALQENADMILNNLREAEISDDEDDEDHCGMSTGDMLDDETMSLVSNESDDEFLSPDGTSPSNAFKHSPKSDYPSPICNGMVALPQCNNGPSKYAFKKVSPPAMSTKNSSLGLSQANNLGVRNENAHPEVALNTKQGHLSNNAPPSSESPKKSALPLRAKESNENVFSKIKPPVSNRHSLDLSSNNGCLNQESKKEEDLAFDNRTFTRKKSTFPRGVAPSIQSAQPSALRSPSSQNIPSLPGSTESLRTSETPKVVTSKIAAAWKSGKIRSKSMVDPNRNSKAKLEKSYSNSSNSSRDEANSTERSPSPQSPLNRSSTYDKLSYHDVPAVNRRPSSLTLQQQKTSSPRHMKAPAATHRTASATQRQGTEAIVRPRTKIDLQSPTSHPNFSNIPKFQNKAQPSLIPKGRSMIPTPSKMEFPDN